MTREPISERRSLVFGEPWLLDWCAAQIPGTDALGWHNQKAQALGLAIDGKLTACMVVHDYHPTHRNCQISFAATSAKWATKPTIRAMMAYPFDQLKCDRLTTIISERNARSIRFNIGIGFKLEGIIRRGYGDCDAMIFGLMRDEAPSWLGLAISPANAHTPLSMAVTA